MSLNEIVMKRVLAESIVEIEVYSPVIARKRKAGQFIILRMHEEGERIPLTIADSDPEKGTITLVFQKVGKSTDELATFEVGDTISDVVGPLGRPTHIEKFGTVAIVGGGCGVAPVYPITCSMKEAGNRIISIIGGRNKELVIMEDSMRAVSDELHVCTDDGSYGFHGFVSDALKKIIDSGEKIDLCVAIGPAPMMRAVSELTRGYEIHTVVSLNTIMVDGTGMCGACRVSVGGVTKFVCVDGPEFDGHKVDWKEMASRMRCYLPQEKISLERFHEKIETHSTVESCNYGA